MGEPVGDGDGLGRERLQSNRRIARHNAQTEGCGEHRELFNEGGDEGGTAILLEREQAT